MNPECTLNGGSSAEPEPKPGDSSGDNNGPAAGTTHESQSLAAEPSSSHRPANRKGTGPRTALGKSIASRNATKHGVYCKVLVLPGESPNEHRKLLAALREAYQPENALQELLVEELASIQLRKRRLRVAEWAVIRKNRESLEWDQRNRGLEKSGMLEPPLGDVSGNGLIQNINNPYILKRCLQKLSQLQKLLEENGFNPERDESILEKIYGERDPDLLRGDLYDNYVIWQYTAGVTEEVRARHGCASPEQCRSKVVRQIQKEIRRLKNYQRERVAIEVKRTQLEILSHSVLDGPELDRQLRCEAHLNREFDRVLSQLERRQRMPLGQPVPPRIEVDLKR